MTPKLSLSCLLLFSSSIFAAGIDASKHLPYGSRNAQLIAPLSSPDQPLIAENTDQFFPPASTLKVVTALAAKLTLPDSFRFETTLYTSGNDLIIKYSGDPTFSRESLTTMLKEAKSEVGSRFNNIWLDDRAFAGYQRGVGWPWDILGVCYSAPASAITLDGNCVQGALYTNSNGSTRVNIPSHQPVSASTTALSVSKQQQEQSHCDLELEVSPNNQYSISGCAVQRQSPIPLKFAVSSPEQFTVDVIKSELQRLGVTLSGEVRVGTPNITSQKPLFVQRSRPLNDLLAVMLKDSNNLYADNITKTLGATYFNEPGSFNNGTEAIKAILKDKAGIDLELAVLEDGSGLSRNNRVTANQMQHVLSYIHNNDSQLKLARLMPVSGNNGTLKYRSSMRKAPIKGALVAKSGSLFGTYNMMGFGLGSKGERESLFVQFVTDYHPQKPTTSKPVESPLTQFEKAYYRQVVDYSFSLERSNNKAQQ
ncbi:serine-type D-Ala-D-Ala carboxypeptidase [Vibrio sp. SCSIO 43140]|uniref:serine-type D-Ala-D-Ala carboxypeptidase n=1 Tax=Vibrio sp. SCSIO 43140 TaxID=2819100 RepID=UPI002075B3BC|nr:serine-type D-Ala-D-Ala carboxypeptidase [Vibrio sp. SCSIO 43140]USD59932.1 serine-type D-Ala-D-Ala carboxypeptidase [Vibrio sp. SCSIO 43140]